MTRKRPLRPHPTIQGAFIVPLTQGKEALVDADVADIVGRYNWCAVRSPSSNTFYAQSRIRGTIVLLHRFLFSLWGIDAPDDIDHIHGDGLDNRREELRPATSSENKANQGRRSNNATGYRGVSWRDDCKKWRVLIMQNGKQYHRGYFERLEDAVAARVAAERDIFGAFARNQKVLNSTN